MYIGGCKIDAAYLGSCALDKVYLGVCEVLSRGPVLPKWQAFVPNPSTGEMAGLVGGTGDVTNARTAPINLRNQDDLYGQQDALAVGYRGGRLVGSTVYGTDENGDPLPEMPWAARFPQATNLITGSRDKLTGWSGTSTTTENTVIGIDGALAATTEADTSDAANQANNFGGLPAISGEYVAISAKIKKDPAATNYIRYRLRNTGVATKSCIMLIRPSDGDIGSYMVDIDYRLEDKGDYWWLTLFAVDAGNGNDQWHLDSYATNSIDGANTQDVTLTGEIGIDAMDWSTVQDIDQAAALFDAPIYTTVADVTRDKDDIVLDAANHNDSQGTYYLEAGLTGACHILGDFLSFDGTLIELTDGTNATSLFQSAGQYKIGIVYGAGKMRLNVDGVWSTEVDYDGTLLSGAFDIGRDSNWPVYVRDLQAFEDKGESIIDELMA